MGNLEVCLGHVTRRCPDCRADDKNPNCRGYYPVSVRVFKVVSVEELVQDAYLNQTIQPTASYVQA